MNSTLLNSKIEDCITNYFNGLNVPHNKQNISRTTKCVFIFIKKTDNIIRLNYSVGSVSESHSQFSQLHSSPSWHSQ